MNRSNSIYLSSFVLVIVCIAIVVGLRVGEEPTATTNSHATAKPHDAETVSAKQEIVTSIPPDLQYRWQRGQCLAYDVNLLTQIGSNYRLQIKGVACFTILDAGEASGRVVLLTCMTGAQYLSYGKRCARMEQLLEQVTGVLEMSIAGQVLDFRTAEYVAADDRNVLRGVFAQSFTLSQADKTSEWETEEVDTNGVVCVKCKRASQDGFTQSRIAYKTLNATLPQSELRIDESLIKVQLGACWIESAHGNERMTFTFQGKPAWNSLNELHMVKRVATSPPEALASLLSQGNAEQVLKSLSEEKPPVIQLAGRSSVSELEETDQRASQSEKVSFEEMMKNTEKTLSQSRTQAERFPAIEALRDWLLARPDQAGRMIERLSDRNAKGEVTAGLIHALELASARPEAQIVLGKMLSSDGQRQFSKEVLLQAAVAAGGVGEVLDETLMNNLFTLAFDLEHSSSLEASDSALLSLGVLAKSNPALRERLSQELTATLDATEPGSASFVTTAWMALANGGVQSPELLAKARECVSNNADEAIRAEALAYLVRVQNDPSFATTALQDKSERVQARAVELLASRDQLDTASVQQLVSVLSDPAQSDTIRAMVAQQNQRHAITHPEIMVACRSVLASNPSTELRGILQQVLGSQKQP